MTPGTKPKEYYRDQYGMHPIFVTPEDIAVVGCIMMFDGAGWVDNSTMPGWYACIAANAGVGCPDMVNRFVMGKVVAGSGATGGSNDAIVVSHNHTFTGSALATHNHTFTGSALANHNHTFTGSSTTTGAGSSHNHVFTGSALGTHGHDFAIYGASGNRNDGTPGYSLAWSNSSALIYRDAAQDAYLRAGSVVAASAGTPAGTVVAASGGTPAGTNAAEATHTHTLTPLGANTAASGGTPAGTLNNVSGGTPAGTISTEGASGTGANRPAYYSMIFIRKCA